MDAPPVLQTEASKLPTDPGIFLHAFEMLRPLAPDASRSDTMIYRMLMLSAAAASAACNVAWDMEEDGDSDVEGWLEEIRTGYYDLTTYPPRDSCNHPASRIYHLTRLFSPHPFSLSPHPFSLSPLARSFSPRPFSLSPRPFSLAIRPLSLASPSLALTVCSISIYPLSRATALSLTLSVYSLPLAARACSFASLASRNHVRAHAGHSSVICVYAPLFSGGPRLLSARIHSFSARIPSFSGSLRSFSCPRSLSTCPRSFSGGPHSLSMLPRSLAASLSTCSPSLSARPLAVCPSARFLSP
ncbi:hypothetical protein VTO73DRAFT_4666 [Trametes versicolor]